jgi:engulfment/cell motility protein 1
MELLEMSFEDTWGQHLQQVREDLKQEALQFVKEQRIRCLLQGAWFNKMGPQAGDDKLDNTNNHNSSHPWRFIRLSYNRRYLHYADFDQKVGLDPGLDALTEKVDLSTISSVVSNVSAPSEDTTSLTSGSTVPRTTTTKITIYSYVKTPGGGEDTEQPVLTLRPVSHSEASEWLDGLLMLLNQAPITAETNKLVNLVSDYGLKIRLLNVRMEVAAFEGPPPGAGMVPSREGLDEDYFFEV